MADHIAVCEIYDDEIDPRFDAADHRIAHRGRAHLRLLIVGFYFRAWYQHASFVRQRLLDAAVKEKRHVGVFFSLGGVKLRKTGFRDHFAKRVFKHRLLKK